MSKSITALEALKKLFSVVEDEYWGCSYFQDYEDAKSIIEQELKILEIIKKHILDRNIDTSGIYLEFHNGHYEPYYTIEIREGIKQIVPLEEYKILKEILR